MICLDEKPITLHAEVRAVSAAEPGREARRDSEYKRCGTANVFFTVEPKAGRHFTFATPDRSAVQFAQVAFELAMRYPDATTIHLVMDNLNIHRRKSLTDLLGEEIGGQVRDRFTVHYTPTHGSWLNQAEIEIGLFSRQRLGTRRIPDLKTLEKEVRAWNREVNRRRGAGEQQTCGKMAYDAARSSTQPACLLDSSQRTFLSLCACICTSFVPEPAAGNGWFRRS